MAQLQSTSITGSLSLAATTVNTGSCGNLWFNTSTNKLQYVGKYIRHVSCGYHDSAQHYAIFDDNGVEVIVKYTYEGTTSFIQVHPKITPELKDGIIQSVNRIPSLKSLAKQQLTTEEIRLANEFGLF